MVTILSTWWWTVMKIIPGWLVLISERKPWRYWNHIPRREPIILNRYFYPLHSHNILILLQGKSLRLHMHCFNFFLFHINYFTWCIWYMDIFASLILCSADKVISAPKGPQNYEHTPGSITQTNEVCCNQSSFHFFHLHAVTFKYDFLCSHRNKTCRA